MAKALAPNSFMVNAGGLNFALFAAQWEFFVETIAFLTVHLWGNCVSRVSKHLQSILNLADSITE
ncbi:hypothetical protein FEE96_20790 [Parasedimentitalea maritima]|uniref:Uncharacterized protein n=1 Tax=Parasedimentitalea maritima TaxID=2578117 RepID=A0ABY2UPV6_9RHOB|nr:hypothetical protein FEE96_20790 [Zongyanglinia marina]